ncbi:MAG: response regulator [Fibrobacter sp.]|nr:response regulator [Fibrobacter sp.]
MSTISTNEDIHKFIHNINELYLLQATRVLVCVEGFAAKKLLASWLDKKRYVKAMHFETGDDLIRAFAESSDKTILVYDLKTPGRNGLEMISVLRKLPGGGKNASIIMCGDNLNFQAIEKLQKLGVGAVLNKPFNEEQLSSAFKSLSMPY